MIMQHSHLEKSIHNQISSPNFFPQFSCQKAKCNDFAKPEICVNDPFFFLFDF